jgi:hypothetical protein
MYAFTLRAPSDQVWKATWIGFKGVTVPGVPVSSLAYSETLLTIWPAADQSRTPESGDEAMKRHPNLRRLPAPGSRG